MLSREENDRFTQVGPGTPGGELLRRYWWPVGFSDDVKGPRPQKVRLLGEEFVLFRDGQGRVGMLEVLCAHRRTSLTLGRVEAEGIRCCYHGWLFDAAGKCLDQPCEDPGNSFKDKIRQKSYPVEEKAGLVFGYLGPLPAPLLPKYDMLEWETGKRVLWSNPVACNWLQSIENACDVSHIPWLHAGPYPGFAAKKPLITWDRTSWGMHFEIRLDGYNDANTGDVIFPSANRFASSREGADVSQLADRNWDARHNLLFRVPEDDVTTRNMFVAIYPDQEHVRITQGHQPKIAGVYEQVDDGWWGIASRDQDRAATEGQGPITDRSTEHLAPSDRGVTMYRAMLRDALRDVAEGRDPIGVVRERRDHQLMQFGTHQHDVVPPLHTFAAAAE
jgi:5,5'-dehydrodivanillate O-demethylase